MKRIELQRRYPNIDIKDVTEIFMSGYIEGRKQKEDSYSKRMMEKLKLAGERVGSAEATYTVLAFEAVEMLGVIADELHKLNGGEFDEN